MRIEEDCPYFLIGSEVETTANEFDLLKHLGLIMLPQMYLEHIFVVPFLTEFGAYQDPAKSGEPLNAALISSVLPLPHK